MYKLQLISPSPSCSIVLLVLEQGLDSYSSFRFLLILLCGLLGISQGQIVQAKLGDLNISQNFVIIIIIIYSLEFFISALADELSLEFEWQQVFLSLQDYSQYSDRCQ